MSAATPSTDSTDQLHARFLAILPRIRLHGLIYFRHLHNRDQRDEFIAEMVALCWLWFCRLIGQGKDPSCFVSALATFAARAVGSGRRLCGQEPATDIFSARTQRQHGFRIQHLHEHTHLTGGFLEEALRCNTESPPDEQAAFRHDFSLWLSRYDPRQRRIALDMALGHRTSDIATFHGCSPGRISQLRRAFFEDWQRLLNGETPVHGARHRYGPLPCSLAESDPPHFTP